MHREERLTEEDSSVYHKALDARLVGAISVQVQNRPGGAEAQAGPNYQGPESLQPQLRDVQNRYEPMIRDLFLDMLGYLPAQIVSAIAGIAFLPVITRFLSPEEYGYYTLVLATVSVLTLITGWLRIAVVRFYPACEEEERLSALYCSVFIGLGLSIAVLGIAFLPVVFALAHVMPTRLHEGMLLGVLLFVLFAVFDVLQSLLRAQRSVHWYTAFTSWRTLAGTGFGILLVIAWNNGVKGLLWGSIASLAFAIPFLWRVSTRRIKLAIKDFSLNLSKEMAMYSFPLVVGNLAAWILRLSDRYVLEFFRGSFEVGLYSVSYRISESSIMLLTSLFALAFNPLSISVWEKQGEEAARRFLKQGTRYFLILCMPAVVGISVLQKPIIALFAAPEYGKGAIVLPWVTAGTLFLGLTQRFGAGLSFHKQTTLFMRCTLAAGGLNLVLNYIFIPSFGFRAAAVSTAISYAFLLMLMVWVSRRFFRWAFPHWSLAKAGAASIVMGAVVYPLGNSLTSSPLIKLIIGIPVGIVIYSTALFLLGEVQSNEKRAVKKVLVRYLPEKLTPCSWK